VIKPQAQTGINTCGTCFTNWTLDASRSLDTSLALDTGLALDASCAS
jgi:hypothetical protein